MRLLGRDEARGRVFFRSGVTPPSLAGRSRGRPPDHSPFHVRGQSVRAQLGGRDTAAAEFAGAAGALGFFRKGATAAAFGNAGCWPAPVGARRHRQTAPTTRDCLFYAPVRGEKQASPTKLGGTCGPQKTTRAFRSARGRGWCNWGRRAGSPAAFTGRHRPGKLTCRSEDLAPRQCQRGTEGVAGKRGLKKPRE